MPSHGGGHMGGGGGFHGGGGFRGGGSFHGGGHSSFSRPSTHSTMHTSRPNVSRGPIFMGPTYTRPYYRRRGGSIFGVLIVFLVFMMLIPMILFSGFSSSTTYPETSGHTVSYQKEPLAGPEFTADILDDELGFATPAQKQELVEDLKYFYDQTGIQPYVLLSNQQNLSSNEEDNYLYQYYVNNFDDENVFLFAYLPGTGNEYDMYYMPGDYTLDIMDSDAIDTFWSNADYYFDKKVGYNDISWIGDTFKSTADSCMTGYTWVEDPVNTPVSQPTSSSFGLSKILGIGVFGILAAFIVSKLTKKKKQNAADIDYGAQYQQQSSSTDYNPYYGDSESYSDQFKNQNQ